MKNPNKSEKLCIISNPCFHNQILNKYLLFKRKGPFPELILQNYENFIKKYLKIFINFEIFNHLFLKFKNLLINTPGEYTIQFFMPQYTAFQFYFRSEEVLDGFSKKDNIFVSTNFIKKFHIHEKKLNFKLVFEKKHITNHSELRSFKVRSENKNLINNFYECSAKYSVSQLATSREFLRFKSKEIQKKENISVLEIFKNESLVMKKFLQKFKSINQPFKYVSYVENRGRNTGNFWEIKIPIWGNRKIKYFYQYLNENPVSKMFKHLDFYLFMREKNILKKFKKIVESEKEPISYSKKMFYGKTCNFWVKDKHMDVIHIQKFEKELKDMKKIISRTAKELYKEVHSLRPIKEMIENHINNHYDVNFLVDKVFDELKRKLRLERERRGF